MNAQTWSVRWTAGAVAILLVMLEAQLLLSVRKESQTFDESAHLYAGALYWAKDDFGVNPEHPPLAKLVAALALLPLHLQVPAPLEIHFRAASAVGGIQFLYTHDADALLFRARAMLTLFTLALGLLVFFAANEMFGSTAGLFALTLYVFEPNILGNGALVTTDLGAACCVFAAVYAFFRYCKKPSLLRVLVCGLTVGLALAVKHSAVLLLPIFLLLSAYEIARYRASTVTANEPASSEPRARKALQLLVSLAAIAALSIAILWSFYGFRYAARPGSQQITPPTAEYLKQLEPSAPARAVGLLEKYHLLPESYLYGLSDIAFLSRQGRPMYLLGKEYANGKWFYFPAAFAIKTTLGFMALLVLVFAAGEMWREESRRALVFLARPAALWLAIAMTSKLDIGFRHILPILPFLIVLAAGGAAMLARRSRGWAAVVALLLAFHVVSTVRAYPNYLPYSNEAWGGPNNTYKVLADSNAGWDGGLKAMVTYINSHHITHCWFANQGMGSAAYYHIPCAPLPTWITMFGLGPGEPVPDRIDGPVFLGSMTLTAFGFGPAELNPYQQFVAVHPSAVLGGDVLVYDGNFHIPQIAGVSHLDAANRLLRKGQVDAALAEARTAEDLDPQMIAVHELLASLYAQKKQPDDATREFQIALHIYQTVHPEFQKWLGDQPKDPLKGN